MSTQIDAGVVFLHRKAIFQSINLHQLIKIRLLEKRWIHTELIKDGTEIVELRINNVGVLA